MPFVLVCMTSLRPHGVAMALPTHEATEREGQVSSIAPAFKEWIDGWEWKLDPTCNESSSYLREGANPGQIVPRYVSITRLRQEQRHAKDVYDKFLKDDLPAMESPVLLDVGAGPGTYDMYVHRHYNNKATVIYFDGRSDQADPRVKHKKALDGYHTDVKVMPFYKNDMECTGKLPLFNGIPQSSVRVLAATPENMASLAGTVDFIYSHGSYGFHYPTSTYAVQAFLALKPGGKMKLCARAGTRIKQLLPKGDGEGHTTVYRSLDPEVQRQQAISVGFRCDKLPSTVGTLKAPSNTWITFICHKPKRAA